MTTAPSLRHESEPPIVTSRHTQASAPATGNRLREATKAELLDMVGGRWLAERALPHRYRRRREDDTAAHDQSCNLRVASAGAQARPEVSIRIVRANFESSPGRQGDNR
jgi:hypothetical protein